ncbi:MAG: hypothetical protein RPT13_03900 [SAR324 cluster bacterium]
MADQTFEGLVAGASGILGSSSSGSGATSGTTTQRQKLNIDEAGVQKIIEDVLGGAEGLASIFGGEQTAGIFNSSVSAQAAGDLASKLAGEIAKLTAEQESVTEVDQETTQESGSGGLLGQAKSLLGGLF